MSHFLFKCTGTAGPTMRQVNENEHFKINDLKKGLNFMRTLTPNWRIFLFIISSFRLKGI